MKAVLFFIFSTNLFTTPPQGPCNFPKPGTKKSNYFKNLGPLEMKKDKREKIKIIYQRTPFLIQE